MEVGDIVRFKESHHLSDFFNTNWIVEYRSIFPKMLKKKPRYHIRALSGELRWTWVYESEIELISDIRNDKLKELGI